MIRFSLAGIPVRVRPTFWLVAGLLGFGIGDLRLVAVWIAIVFVSVLVHELGHALVARRFGADVDITLTTLGGLTAWRLPGGQMTPGRRALVAASGSAVGILMGLAVLGLYLVTRPGGATAGFVVTMIVWVNVGWGVLNWLPIRPLDGGHLVTALLEVVAPRRGERIANAIFLVSALAAVGAAAYFRLVFVMVLAGFMAWWEVARHFSWGAGTAEPLEFSYEDPPEPEPDADRPIPPEER